MIGVQIGRGADEDRARPHLTQDGDQSPTKAAALRVGAATAFALQLTVSETEFVHGGGVDAKVG